MRKPTGQLKFAYDTIARQQIKIEQMEAKIESLQDEVNKRRSWLYEAKQRVNVSDGISFDNVWKRVVDLYDSNKINFDNL